MEILKEISTHIDCGNFVVAENLCNQLLGDIEKKNQKSKTTYTVLFNLAGFFVDLGHMARRKDLGRIGIDLMTDHKESFLAAIPSKRVNRTGHDQG